MKDTTLNGDCLSLHCSCYEKRPYPFLSGGGSESKSSQVTSVRVPATNDPGVSVWKQQSTISTSAVDTDAAILSIRMLSNFPPPPPSSFAGRCHSLVWYVPTVCHRNGNGNGMNVRCRAGLGWAVTVVALRWVSLLCVVVWCGVVSTRLGTSLDHSTFLPLSHREKVRSVV
mmetsp:Transcript_49143/g.49920  ORF Transcript_49143/g.49920 Transcript_49143/m.49920 type:complete len:171 (+) Transcript_49143:263-775(+)